MPYFPQLTTGAVAQFPVSKRRSFRTVLAAAPGGAEAKLEDPGAPARTWELDFTALSAAEVSALESLFLATEGSLREFTFLDPFANLLSHSESLTQPGWVKSALLQVAAGIADPFGTARASRLTASGGAIGTLGQDVPGPGNYWYSMSCYVRAATFASITLRCSAGAASASEVCAAGPGWRRIGLSGHLATETSPIRFEIRLPAGTVVDVFGMQVEAQRSASGYKRTGAATGIYANAVFDRDELEIHAEPGNQFSTTVYIRTR